MLSARHLIVFLLIVLTPLGAAAWLGLKVARDEQEISRHQLETLLEGRLRDVDSTIAATVREVERHLLDQVLTPERTRLDDDQGLDDGLGDRPGDASSSDAELAAASVDALRSIRRDEPFVRELFVVDARGRLVFPPDDPTASADERAFLTRTAAIWRGDAMLHAPPVPETRAARPDPGPEREPGDSILALARSRPHGWMAWYWEEGLHLLFWRRLPGGGVLGVEVERVALLARVVGSLPASELEDGRVVLMDARGRAVHQWGPYEPPAGAEPVVAIPVQAPLHAWRLRHHASPAQMQALAGAALQLNLMVGLAAIGLALLAMSALFYRDYTRKMRDAAERVSFVTRVSHELKTPLTNIRLYAELIESSLVDEDDKTERRLAVIIAESQRLTRLINNVLALSKQRRDQLAVHKEPIHIDEVIASVLAQFGPALAAKGVECSFTPGAGEAVYADADAIGQIVANLVSNVEKYASAGGVVEIATEQGPSRTVVRVADRGPGIDAAHRDKIFRPFYRVSDRLADGVTGTGIGLSIARELARAGGGELRLVPAEVGACFELSLPNREDTP